MPKLPALLVAAALAVPAVAAADVHVYTRVNEVTFRSSGSYAEIRVDGVTTSGELTQEYNQYAGSQGNTNTSTAETCQRSATLAMSKPGRYLLKVEYQTYLDDLILISCSLRRVEPEAGQ